MTGTIRGADVVSHPILIIKIGGTRALLRCLVAIALRRRCTFLDLVWRKRS